MKKNLHDFWEKSNYINDARRAHLEGVKINVGLKRLEEYTKKASTVCDCGCGDGTTIEMLWHPKAIFFGIDISARAIASGSKRLKDKKNVSLAVGNIENLNFPDEYFDLVYLCSILEHLENPEKVIREMIRVTKKDGFLIFLSPNYGSPLESSPSGPPKGETPISRALKQLFKSHQYLIRKPGDLDWLKVEPLCLREGRWQPDWDTVVEPYLQTLIYFLEKNRLAITEVKTHLIAGKRRKTTLVTVRQKLLRLAKEVVGKLGEMNISPYKYFGPDFFVVARK